MTLFKNLGNHNPDRKHYKRSNGGRAVLQSSLQIPLF